MPTYRWSTCWECSYSSRWTTMATWTWAKLHTQSMSCVWAVMHLPKAALTTIHSAISLTACLVTCDHQTHNIDLLERKLPCMLPTNSTGIVFALTLFHIDAAGWQWSFTLILLVFAKVHIGVTFNHHEMFECVHLEFMVSGQSKQTSIYRYTHACAMQSQ